MIALAWAALFLWPLVGVFLYRMLSLPLALCLTIVGGYLLLPSNIGLDLPVLPEFNKHTIPTLTALVLTIVALMQPRQAMRVLPGWLPRDPVALGLLGMLVIGVFGTVLTNTDPLVYGPRFIRGMQIYDGFSLLLTSTMLLLPLLLGRRILATREAQKTLLVVFAVSALIYSLPALWEVRMSPLLHRQFYGYFPHSFHQQMRAGGFRPMVFLNHGLSVGFFFAFGVLAAAGLFRLANPGQRAKWVLGTCWLLITLILAKSLGALMIVGMLLPVVVLLTPRTRLLIAAVIAGVVLTYPTLRNLDVIPIDRVSAFAERIDPARAQSLNFRIENEEILLEKARERSLFGWGMWSRNRVYDEMGLDISVTDGAWVLEIGVGGWFRYLALFGLLCWPVIGLFISKRDRIDPVCSILALMLCAKLIDLLPNAGMVPYVWLIAGSLLGRLEMKASDLRGEEVPEPASAGAVGTRYARTWLDVSPTRQAHPSRYARNLGTSSADPQERAPGSSSSRTVPSYTRHRRVRKK